MPVDGACQRRLCRPDPDANRDEGSQQLAQGQRAGLNRCQIGPPSAQREPGYADVRSPRPGCTARKGCSPSRRTGTPARRRRTTVPVGRQDGARSPGSASRQGRVQPIRARQQQQRRPWPVRERSLWHGRDAARPRPARGRGSGRSGRLRTRPSGRAAAINRAVTSVAGGAPVPPGAERGKGQGACSWPVPDTSTAGARASPGPPASAASHHLSP